MNNVDHIIDSFQIKDTLNPAIFDTENNSMKIDVRKTLLSIANDFKENLKIMPALEDIYLMGSNANYNWSEYSDVDLHILMDFSSVDMDTDTLQQYFDNAKTVFNQQHNLTIDIYPIEVYVQDKKEDIPQNTGIYSVLNDYWVHEPQKDVAVFDKKAITSSLANFTNKLKDLLNNPDKEKGVSDAREFLWNARSGALAKGGEFSPGNLAFKVLRRLGVQDKLKDVQNGFYDKKHSIRPKTDSYAGDNGAISAKNDEAYSDGIYYIIHGLKFDSLRDAEKSLREKRSTIQYRVHSKNPKWSDYKMVYSKK